MVNKSKNLYIDKEEFHESLVLYKEGKGGKKIEDYVGKCVLAICNNLAKKSCWSGYTYVDEMKEDGIENCIKAIRSYDVNNEKKKFNCYKCSFTSGNNDVFDFVAVSEGIPRGKAILL